MKKTIVIGAAFIVLAILIIAPWMDERQICDRVLREKGPVDGTIDKKGNVVCAYGASWVPFGRWVTSCEGGYYVTMWGQIL